jgi:hypothetical protein
MKFFCWLILKDRLNTRNMLNRWHFSINSGYACPMCDNPMQWSTTTVLSSLTARIPWHRNNNCGQRHIIHERKHTSRATHCSIPNQRNSQQPCTLTTGRDYRKERTCWVLIKTWWAVSVLALARIRGSHRTSSFTDKEDKVLYVSWLAISEDSINESQQKYHEYWRKLSQ